MMDTGLKIVLGFLLVFSANMVFGQSPEEGQRDRDQTIEVNNDAVKTGAVNIGSTDNVTDRTVDATNTQINNNEIPANRRSQKPHSRPADMNTETNSIGNEKTEIPKWK